MKKLLCLLIYSVSLLSKVDGQPFLREIDLEMRKYAPQIISFIKTPCTLDFESIIKNLGKDTLYTTDSLFCMFYLDSTLRYYFPVPKALGVGDSFLMSYKINIADAKFNSNDRSFSLECYAYNSNRSAILPETQATWNNNRYTYDNIMVRNSTSSINKTDIQAAIAIYPNPANTAIRINNCITCEVSVFTLTGALALYQKNYTSAQPLNIEKLTPGTYFLKVNQNNYVTEHKLIKL